MRVLFEQGGYAFQNVGDWAMLKTAVTRLREVCPDAEIHVAAIADVPLLECLPGALLWPMDRQHLLLHFGYLFSNSLVFRSRLESLARRHPRRALSLLRAKERIRPGFMAAQLAEQIELVGNCDAVVSSGGGFITDSFPEMVDGVLGTLAVAQGLGKPTAMFGQGLGPLNTPEHVDKARRVLPNLGILTLREPLASADLARRLGVPADRLVVTGDDATELGYSLRPESPGKDVGFNLRLASYSGADRSSTSSVGATVAEFCRSQDIQPQVIPISLDSNQDWDDSWHALGVPQPGPCPVRTPEDAIRIAGQCRVTVTGSYHAGVFSLSQGVPAIGLVQSPYYADKFRGLAALYPEACTWIDLSSSASSADLQKALEKFYFGGEDIREGALAKSAEIVAHSRECHLRFYRQLLQLRT